MLIFAGINPVYSPKRFAGAIGINRYLYNYITKNV